MTEATNTSTKEEIVIDVGIPIPARTTPGRTAQYPWADMQVGDSFLMKDRKSKSVGSTVSQAAKRFNMKFTTRAEGTGVRVWRTA